MKHLLALFLALFAFAAQAQTIPAQLAWTNPTTSIDGVPLTGANALTGIEVHWSTAAIADTDLTRAAQVTLGVVATTTQNIAAMNGSTIFFRLRAVRGAEKSVFSNQASKVVSLSTVPLPPTNLNITFVVSQAEDGSITMAMLVDEAREFTIYNGG